MTSKRKANVLYDGARFKDGTRFVHPEYGECVVLTNGEWTFKVDGCTQLEAHVYFRIAAVKVSELVLSNHTMWDNDKGIAHERSSKVCSLIARPVSVLSDGFASTASARLAAFKMHPAFQKDHLASFLSGNPTGFAAALKAASPGAFKLARAAAKRFKKDMARAGGAAAVRVTMRALVTAVAMLADCARSSLKSNRPRTVDANETAGYAQTLEVTLDENGARYLETLLSLSGFLQGNKNDWKPACAEATSIFIGAHAHPTGVNPLRQVWTFPAGEVRAWLGDKAPKVRQLASTQKAPNGAVYAAAEIELGAIAHDDTGMLPAYLLRDMLEGEWIAKKDVRLRAHAEIIPELVRVYIMNKTIAGAGGGATYHRRRRPY